MPLNSPSGSTNNISFGPAKIYLGQWHARDSNNEYDKAVYTGSPLYTGQAGITPAVDVGFIGEDGINLELTSEKRNIVQGNPQLISYSFATSQAAMFSFTSIEWNFTNFRLALGAGSTALPTNGEPTTARSFFNFGGNPLNTTACMRMQHQMAVTGDTLTIYAWKVQSESGFAIPFSATEEHKFEFSFQALLADYNWGGGNLPDEESLIRFERWAYPGT